VDPKSCPESVRDTGKLSKRFIENNHCAAGEGSRDLGSIHGRRKGNNPDRLWDTNIYPPVWAIPVTVRGDKAARE
jgi:hypothetical protein